MGRLIQSEGLFFLNIFSKAKTRGTFLKHSLQRLISVFGALRRAYSMIRDVLVADLFHTTPNGLKWLYRLHIKKTIASYPLQEITRATTKLSGFTRKIYGKRAVVYFHEGLQECKELPAVIFLHGVHGHPLSLLHLADIAAKVTQGPIFSLYLPYDEYSPEIHRRHIKNALDNIENLMGKSKGFVVVGHSLGAIEFAYRAFSEKDERILTTISIAGRLKVVPSKDKACSEHLKSTVESVYQGIQDHPHLPLYQIAAVKDWNAPLEATVVRKDENCFHVVENAMHLNVLYHKETLQKFAEFLKKSIQGP